MKVMKFGGTSVGKPQRMHDVAKLIATGDEQKIVVLSAVSGTTNALVEIGQLLSQNKKQDALKKIKELETSYKDFVIQLLSTETSRSKADEVLKEHFEFLEIILKISYNQALNKDILAQGELLSTKLFSIYLEEQGIDHQLIPALEFMYIDANDEPRIEIIRQKLSTLLALSRGKNIFITQGFICRNARGEIDNLKRGGSDYTASLIAAAVNASVCEIWTDISGMHNNDPRIVENTKAIEQLSFDEAAELAYFGAKILHPASIWPAQQFRIPVRLLNTMEPHANGTLISEKATGNGVKAIAAKDGITAINIKSSRMLLAYGFLRKVFEVFEEHRTPIDMITTSEVAVSLTIDNDAALKEIVSELSAFSSVTIDKEQSIISIVGNEVAENTTTLEKVFNSLGDVHVRMVSYGGSAHNISLLVPAENKVKVLRQLNKGLFDL